MSLWFFRTWLGLSGAPPDIRQACFLSDCTLHPGLGLDLVFWVFHVWFFSGSPSGRGGGVVLCFRHGFVTLCSGPSLAPRLAGFTVPARPTRDKSQWENVISCGGGQVFLVRLGGASSAVRAVHIATGCSVKVGLSFSVSFWLRMPGHEGAGSRSRNGLFCVPWARCTRAVAPCLLCEEHAVILVDGCGCGASAHPWEASASSLLSLGSSHPSTGAVGGGAGPGLTRSCSPGHITASDLVPGPWALLPRLSPAIRLPPMVLARLGGSCMSPHFEKLSVLFPGNIGSHFLGISRSFCGNV